MRYLRHTALLLSYLTVLTTAIILSACGGSERDPVLGLPAAALVSVAVSPATASVAAGGAQQFLATASFADGSARDVTTAAAWSSATPAVASVGAQSGAAAGLTTGQTVISATYSGKNGSATLTVTPASLTALAISPANASIAAGLNQQYTAMGSFSDGSTRDITSVSSFASSSPLLASINASTGLARGLSSGSTQITATSGIRSASTGLTISPAVLLSLGLAPQAPSLSVGATRQLQATALYSDNASVDVSASSVYLSAAPATASVSNGGLVTALLPGSALMTASFGGKSATSLVTVSAASLTSISVTPANASVVIGATQAYVATASNSDGSTADISNSATWTSASPLTATVLPGGLARGVAAGSAMLTASFGGKSATANLTVTSLPVVPPVPASLNLGTASSFAVLAGTSITNNSGGTTLVTGDVGAPSQSTDPVQTAGYANYKSGAILAAALADLQVAISDANSRSCSVNSASGIDLGGLVFTPGVYCYAGSINITGTFTMNGPGLYIFRTSSTLNTTANSIVALSAGAAASDLFWVPVAPTTLGANSVFKGSVLGQSAAITMGDNATLQNGRVLSAAAVTLRNNQISK